MTVSRALIGIVLGLAAACGAAKLPSPDYVAHPTSALVPVPYPPPAPRVEAVPKQPEEGMVWLDGEWLWQTRRWTWRRGRWVKPPAGARYAPWTTVRDEHGNLFFAASSWRGSDGEEIAEPKTPGGAPGLTERDVEVEEEDAGDDCGPPESVIPSQ